MKRPSLVAVRSSFTALSLLFLLPLGAEAQLGGLGKKVKEKAQGRAAASVDRAIDRKLDRVECAVTDEKCISDAQAAGQEVTLVDETAGAGGEAGAMKPGEGAWANYDFVPGSRVLFADDFMGDKVGDFPRRMEFQAGAMEIVEWQGQRWLRATADESRFYVVLPEALPERFTMEFDYAIPTGEVWVHFGENHNRRLAFAGEGRVQAYNAEAGVDAHGAYGDGDPSRIRRARVMADGRYVKVYLDDKRILNVPNADLERSNRISFHTDAYEADPSLFANFRVAAGDVTLYDALTAEGRVATQGIYFDSGSDRLRPESTPTLVEIATMLKEHGDLALTIEGHTDAMGDDAANQALSQRRAEAVKAYLIADHGIAAERLDAVGHGESQPAASNDTPDGRQQNRRVELVRR